LVLIPRHQTEDQGDLLETVTFLYKCVD